MRKYRNSIFTILLSTSLGWNINKLYRQNNLDMYGLKNDHDIIVVRHINIYDKKENENNKNNILNENNKNNILNENNKNNILNENNKNNILNESNKNNILNEKELLNFLDRFTTINKKYKGFCETSVFKNSSFSSNMKNEYSDGTFNTYLVIDKWKNHNDFEKSKKEFQNLFLYNNDIYNKKMQDFYYNFQLYRNNYETTSATNIFTKLFSMLF
ncbi:hypothetical protein PFBG_04309 [Plasmodium falciparum 7G8]|uniref:Uncharacterized protein n=5 Tax=Plasmodium falciparum TaxID=5833 RepID=Q8IES2_PLAF7|nr:conserved Plasmodium protein, unknown function [Plasmodium falciparum 3D7]ETW17052.1 hypothetical protein PFFVO_03881 [Plasmodium falciparum Vietnam Oak-Knoll (FVO)]EUR66729.1 hypothetical protein PFBG_04309 [Plasmodium falciparum 7G8]EWC86932.1 hypothetical protein PFNF54_04112 [Plasmodium falciparum NF54]KAF4329815.1 hypothetical protein CYL21_1953 [Plasmodium falciparum NF54]PKC47315.1 hypothetical protein CK202_2959 [Plasmodium falciparum NF54]|eukprot:XP_001349770.1 conserved Plasmodium protein, unknown function [Plasmodium falciparum 3D7]